MDKIPVGNAVDALLESVPVAELATADELAAIREFNESKAEFENMKCGLGGEDSGREHGAFLARFRANPADDEARAFITQWPDVGQYRANRQALLETLDETIRQRTRRIVPIMASIAERCRLAAVRLADEVAKEERALWRKWTGMESPPTPIADAVRAWRVEGHCEQKPHPNLGGALWPREPFAIHRKNITGVLPRRVCEALAKDPGPQREASGGASHPSR